MRPAAPSLLLLAPLLAGGCAMGGPSPVRYVGQAPACGRTEGGGATATLTRLGSGFAFTPYDGVLVVEGTVAPNGALAGALAIRPAQSAAVAGATTKPKPGQAQAITVVGRLTAESATVSYAAPNCAAAVLLSRVHPALM